MADLTSAYLQWKHGPPPSDDVPADVYRFEVTAVYTDGKSARPVPLFSHRRWAEYTPVLQVPQATNELANVALLRRGLLGCTPSQPRLAISLRSLEFYHQLRRRQSSFSIQAMVKTLCSLNDVCVFRASIMLTADDSCIDNVCAASSRSILRRFRCVPGHPPAPSHCHQQGARQIC